MYLFTIATYLPLGLLLRRRTAPDFGSPHTSGERWWGDATIASRLIMHRIAARLFPRRSINGALET